MIIINNDREKQTLTYTTITEKQQEKIYESIGVESPQVEKNMPKKGLFFGIPTGFILIAALIVLAAIIIRIKNKMS